MKTITAFLILIFSFGLAQAQTSTFDQILNAPTNLIESVADQTQVAFLFGPRVPRRIESTGRKTFMFDPKRYWWAAYDERGKLIKHGRASGGSAKCPESNRSCRTPTGVYKIYRIGSEQCKSRTYPLGVGGAPMPYCMFFHDGSAIHGAYGKVPKIHASHGCIRVNMQDAAWLNRYFINYNTLVVVKPY